MKAQIDIEKTIQDITESVQSAAWVLEPREPPTRLSRYLKSLEDCPRCIPMDSIIIREKGSAVGLPNEEVTNESP